MKKLRSIFLSLFLPLCVAFASNAALSPDDAAVLPDNQVSSLCPSLQTHHDTVGHQIGLYTFTTPVLDVL